MGALDAAIAATALTLLPGWGVKPEPSLEKGFAEFLELRPFCSSSLTTRLISCSNNALIASGNACQSESVTPAGGANIPGFLVLRSTRMPWICQGRQALELAKNGYHIRG